MLSCTYALCSREIYKHMNENWGWAANSGESPREVWEPWIMSLPCTEWLWQLVPSLPLCLSLLVSSSIKERWKYLWQSVIGPVSATTKWPVNSVSKISQTGLSLGGWWGGGGGGSLLHFGLTDLASCTHMLKHVLRIFARDEVIRCILAPWWRHELKVMGLLMMI